MGTVKTWDGTCYCCGESRKVRQSGDKTICARCDHLRAEVKLRPELVVTIIRDIAPELLGQHQAANEQAGNCDTCEVASWAASYRQLCGELKATDGEDIVEVAKRRMATMAKLEAAYLQESVSLSNAEAERDDLKRQLAALPMPEPVAIDRQAVQNLALRLAVSVMKGEITDLGVGDVEMLRDMA